MRFYGDLVGLGRSLGRKFNEIWKIFSEVSWRFDEVRKEIQVL